MDANSAGTHPQGLNPLAVRVMAEAGVDISRHTSKHLSDFRAQSFDYVITVCDAAHEACPVFPAATRTVHIPFNDPPRLAAAATSDDEALPHYRRVRDQIRTFIETLPASLAASPTPTQCVERSTP